MWEELRAHAIKMRRLADEAELAAVDAGDRIADAKRRLDVACAKLERRWK